MDQKHPSLCDNDCNNEADTLENVPEHVRNTTENEEVLCDLIKFAQEYNDTTLCDMIMSKHGIMIFKSYFSDQITVLHIVAKYGRPELVKSLIEFGAKVDIQDAEGRTPLYESLQNGNAKGMYDIFLNHGANIYVRCKKNISPLLQALFFGSLEMIECFLKLPKHEEHEALTKVHRCRRILTTVFAQKINFKLCITDFPVLFFFAARYCNYEVFNIVVEEYKKFIESKSGDGEMENVGKEITHLKEVNVRGHYGRTALHYAVRENLSDAVRFLIKQGADVNAKTEKSYTPLHYAAAFENKEIIEILLKAGADVNVKSTDYYYEDTMITPLDLVCGNLPFRNLLQEGHGIDYDEYITDLTFAENGNIFNSKIIKLLLENGADIEPLKKKAAEFFFETCESGVLDLVKLFFKCGPYVDKLNQIYSFEHIDMTALQFAGWEDNFAVVDFILQQCNFDINATNESGDSVLHASVKFPSAGMIEFLADMGANINALNDNGDTPLHLATSLEALISLSELKPDIQVQNQQNYTPLFHQLVTIIREKHKPPSEVHFIPFMALRVNDIGAYIANSDTLDEWQGVFSFFEECKREIDQVKKRIVSNIRFSFYEFLTLDIYSVITVAKNEKVMKVLEAYGYQKQFPIYKPFLEQRIRTVKSLTVSAEKTMEFLKEYGEFKLPPFIIEIILSYLLTRDFRNFGRALSVWKD